MAHVLRTCLFALHLGRALRLSERELTNTYYTTLLRFVGCTADSHELLDFAGGDDVRFRQLMLTISSDTPDEMAPRLVRFLDEAGVGGDLSMRAQNAIEAPDGIGSRIAAAHCEVATLLASRLGLDSTVCAALGLAFERWDGLGHPHGYARDEVPIAIRLAVVARDIEVLTRIGRIAEVRSVLTRRRGHAYDPRIVDAFLKCEAEILRAAESKDPWQGVLSCEPGKPMWVSPDKIDTTLTAFADFADAKTPFFVGHSRGVARLAEVAIGALGAAPADVERVRRAALMQDIGRSGIPNTIWERKGQLSIEDWERVRLHPYYTERILNRSEGLRSVCALASAHHERLDGSGYHRGSRGAELDMAARVVAAADSCQAMMHPRPHRAARCLEDVARELRADAAGGRLDARAVEAVLGAATGGTPRAAKPSNPGRLTDREVAVLRLMAQGHPNREMAASLGITAKTVGHHVQHIYDKIGVSTRAAAAIFAVEHQLL
jgi:HD-GYP domain-containing protein (c-di-GMP phosphodiesterase class II)